MELKIAENLDRVTRVGKAQGLPEMLKASQVSIDVCEHGTLYINLHDEDGAVFACASMLPLQGARFLLLGTEQLEERVGALEQLANPN